MKRWLNLAGAAVSLACGLYFLFALKEHSAVLATAGVNITSWWASLAALTLYVSTLGTSAVSWQRSLLVFGVDLPLRRILDILALSQFAKYLPGNVGHHVGRVFLSKRAGLSTESILSSMVLDTVLLMSAGALLSLLALDLLQEHASRWAESILWAAIALVAAALLAGGGLLSHEALRSRLTGLARHFRTLNATRVCALLGVGAAANGVSFLVGATALYIICGSVAEQPASWGAWLVVVGVYAAAWLLGFIIPGAPAGLGVREVVLLLGLSPVYGEQAAMAAVVILRLVTTLGDGFIFLLAIGRKKLARVPRG